MTAAEIAAVLGGHRNGPGFLVRCPVTTHGQGRGDRSPSLSIRDGDDQLLVRCFAGCDPRDVLAELRSRGLLDDRHRDHRQHCRHERLEQPPEPDPEALAIWRAAKPVAGTVAETYLRSRGITIPPPATLRAGVVTHLGRFQFPALVAAVQRPTDRTVVATQRTTLRQDGTRKAPIATPRITTGTLGGGAVRLAPAGEVLGIAEGVETGLSAMQASGVPVWCCIGAARMHRVAIPSVVRELHIFADDDEPGRAAAHRTAEAHTAAGRRVIVRRPPENCKDWNDAVRASAEVPAW